MQPATTRRTFLSRFRRLGMLSLMAGGGAYGYGSLLERHRVVVERKEVTLPLGVRGPHKVRAVVMSDFHFDPLHEEEFISHCVRTANDLQPDVVLLPGDFISNSGRRMADLAKLLGELTPKHGIFASLGNHDSWHHTSLVKAGLMKHGVDLLADAHSRFTCNGGELIIAGLQSAWAGYPDWGHASRGIRPDERALLLMHEPDYIAEFHGEKRVALQVSGHTHGGQIRVPGVGALRLPRWGREYQAGFYSANGMNLYVTRGIGTIGVHVRIFCPPEITCLEIANQDLVV